jgi:DnaJ-class molecular chaperone
MANVRDLYRVLGVRRSATVAEIKAAFRKKAQLYHPDHNPGKVEWANKRLAGIVEAYEVLCDPAKRRQLDRQLALKRQTAVRRDAGLQSEGGTRSQNQIIVDIMRHRATPGWARTVAFAYIFLQYYSKER